MAQIPARTSHPCQLANKQTGDVWEPTACDWLLSKGLHLIVANVRECGGEIDLIMHEGNTTVFVGVRYRYSTQSGGATASVTRSRRHRLLQTAHLWLAYHNGSSDAMGCRFDMLTSVGGDAEWFKDAFNDRSQLRIQSPVLKDQRVRQN